jgi:hypothetical protein
MNRRAVAHRCYAFFFKDPDDIKYEIVTHEGAHRKTSGAA